MPLSEFPPSDTEVSIIGNKLLTRIKVSGRDEPISIWMAERVAARYVMQLQMKLREMNGSDPLPDHPGWGDATRESS